MNKKINNKRRKASHNRSKRRQNKLKYSNSDLEMFSPIKGTVEIQRNGHGYLIADSFKESEDNDTEKPFYGEDLFIHKNNLNTAMNKDIVTVKVVMDDSDKGNGFQGIVTEIVNRNITRFSGEINVDPANGYGFVRTADKNKINTDIFIPERNLNGATHKDIVVVDFQKWELNEKSPTGLVREVLGKQGVHEAEMKMILNDNNICYNFPLEVEAEAKAIPTEISEKEINSRKDMREVLTLTIDPESAKDFDDAISFKELDNGKYEIGIHIADVSHYIKPGSALDREAYSRATSTYLVDRCIPMLPEVLSNGICSLRPNEDKLCFSVIFEIDGDGKIYKEQFKKTVINSDYRFTYEEAQDIIEGNYEGNPSYVEQVIERLNDIAKNVRSKRFKKGATSFNRKEPQFILDEDGKPTDVFFYESHEAHQLIEEYMLLANKSVATFANKKSKPFVYRTHDLPNIEKLLELSNFVKNFGYELEVSEDSEKTKKSLNKLLAEVQDKEESNVIETLAIRSMSKAVYSTELIGHYGLGFKYYSHFTSPIRRYPDVIAHRLLWKYVNHKNGDISKLDEQCKYCSDRENDAAKAQRDSIKYKQCEFLSDKIGEEFTGIISTIKDFGVFIELEENGCDGMLSKNHLDSEHMFINVDKYVIEDYKNGGTLSLGDTVKVKVSKVDMDRRQINFSLVG